MTNEAFDPNTTWAHVRSGGDARVRRPGASASRKALELRPRGLGAVLARLRKSAREDASWATGARGERLVGRALEALTGSWEVVHDVPLGGTEANVDHVVAGPPGVFALNTKNLSGDVWIASRTFMVNGYRRDYLRKSRAEERKVSAAVERALGRKLPVRAVLVVIAPSVTVKEPAEGVDVVRAEDLVSWLTSLPQSLDEPLARLARRAIREESTWNPRIAPPRVVSHAPARLGGEPADAGDAGDFGFKPWRRYGKRRLYVKDANGSDIGYYDEVAEELHVVDETLRPAVEAALAEHLAPYAQ